MQGSAGANSPFLHEHDKMHVPVNENQTEVSIKSLIELPLDKVNGEQNNHLLLSCPYVPSDIPIDIPVPCKENKNGEIQQLIAHWMGHVIMTVTMMTKRKFHQITTLKNKMHNLKIT